MAFLEECVTKRKAHGFTDAVTLTVRGDGQGESGKGGAGKVLGVEVGEEVRGNLLPEGVDVLFGDGGVERGPVDQFERPGRARGWLRRRARAVSASERQFGAQHG